MSQHHTTPHRANQPGHSFPVNLAIGAMLASLLIVAYAALASAESAERAQVILQGAQIILLTLSAGVIATVVHGLGLAAEQTREVALPFPGRRTA
jgi:hypothetical protein